VQNCGYGCIEIPLTGNYRLTKPGKSDDPWYINFDDGVGNPVEALFIDSNYLVMNYYDRYLNEAARDTVWYFINLNDGKKTVVDSRIEYENNLDILNLKNTVLIPVDSLYLVLNRADL
jgi:hypothetical protein